MAKRIEVSDLNIYYGEQAGDDRGDARHHVDEERDSSCKAVAGTVFDEVDRGEDADRDRDDGGGQGDEKRSDDRVQRSAAFADDAERYPHVDLARLRDAELDAVLLPDEPYAFAADDGPEAFPGVRSVLVSGRDLTWYGPSLATARRRLLAAVRG